MKRDLIVIIAFNQPELLLPQVEMLRRYIKSENKTNKYAIWVVDNSRDMAASQRILDTAYACGCEYMRVYSPENDNSRSHAFALNMAYRNLRPQAKHIILLDHDVFPLEEMYIDDLFAGHKVFGLRQEKPKGYYLWPGLIGIDVFTMGTDFCPDFSVDTENGFDTGGKLKGLIDHISGDVKYITEKPSVLEDEKVYLLHDDRWVHFSKGSSWDNLMVDASARNEKLIKALKSEDDSEGMVD